MPWLLPAPQKNVNKMFISTLDQQAFFVVAAMMNGL
jgi:hypothetical protein